MGLVFKIEVEKLLGFRFQSARPYAFDRNMTTLASKLARTASTILLTSSKMQDKPGRDFKTVLQEIAKIHKGEFWLTVNQYLIISNIATPDLPEIKRLLAHYKLDNLDFSGLLLSSSACVAFPTCIK
jgi:sulfite reductase (NADPH) hemoprotein beta-component